MGASCWEETAASELNKCCFRAEFCFRAERCSCALLPTGALGWEHHSCLSMAMLASPHLQDSMSPDTPRKASQRTDSPHTPKDRISFISPTAASPQPPMTGSPYAQAALCPFPFRSPSTSISSRTGPPHLLLQDRLPSAWIPSQPPWTSSPQPPQTRDPQERIPSRPSAQAAFSRSSAGTAGVQQPPFPPRCVLPPAFPRPARRSPRSPPAVIRAELTAAPHDTLVRHVSPAIA